MNYQMRKLHRLNNTIFDKAAANLPDARLRRFQDGEVHDEADYYDFTSRVNRAHLCYCWSWTPNSYSKHCGA